MIPRENAALLEKVERLEREKSRVCGSCEVHGRGQDPFFCAVKGKIRSDTANACHKYRAACEKGEER